MSTVLIVDDDEDFLTATKKLLEILGHSVKTTISLKGANEILKYATFDNILLDLLLPDGSGLHLIREIEKLPNKPKATLITGQSIVKNLIKYIDNPQFSFLVKPIDLEKLKNLISPKEKYNRSFYNTHFGHLIGESNAMVELYRTIERIAKTNANVMLIGESGTGKEMFARAIHWSSNPSSAFIAVNCGAFSKELIASELFGHEKGAFTGAVSRKLGVFEHANQGTLFLDEITEMPLEDQSALLRALETRQITRLGGTATINFNCRVISATNRSETELSTGKYLRKDLFYRLAALPLNIPTLRNRKSDIPLLANAFLDSLNNEHGADTYFTKQDLKRLEEYHWPGNVRELKHTVQRSFIYAESSQGNVALPDKLSSPFAKTISSTEKHGSLFGRTLEDVEMELILTTLEQLNQNKSTAAKMLGISLKTLYNKLNRYNLETE